MIQSVFSFLFSFIILLSFAEADEAKTVCLNMIVKDESAVITRCLESVKPLINAWVIVDTGSTDNTKELIQQCMKGIPGELHERPWINFEHNRNEALSLAKGKGDYILFIDADEILSFPSHYVLPKLDKDFYYIMTDYSGMQYARVGLIKSQLPWKWVGVVHEVIDTSIAGSFDTLTDVKNIVHTDGARSKDSRKFYKDAQMLEAALQKNPNSTRDLFYLAQSYRDAEEHELALKNYEKRVAMGGWDQEVFWSLLQIGILHETLEKPAETVANSYLKAYLMRPTRAEPLYRLASYFRRKGDYFSGYLAARQGLTIPLSDDILFVERWIYDYGLLFEYSICAYWIGNYQESKLASKLLLGKTLPTNIRECVLKNLTWIDEKAKPQELLSELEKATELTTETLADSAK